MKRCIIIFLLLISVIISGCKNLTCPRTNAEKQSGYTYIPIDPFPVSVKSDSEKNIPVGMLKYKELSKYLPDNTVRISVEQFDATGEVSYGAIGLSSKGGSYRVTLDYINADTASIELWIRKSMLKNESARPKTTVSLFDTKYTTGKFGQYVSGTEQYEVFRELPSDSDFDSDGFVKYKIPIYIGIGLRITAYIKSLKGKVNIVGLGSISAQAEAENLSGSLVVQTLGVNGKSIASALPIQSELNRTTTQNAVVAVGSIKAILYNDEESTTVVPRVVGLYAPFPIDQALLNKIISEISFGEFFWTPPHEQIVLKN